MQDINAAIMTIRAFPAQLQAAVAHIRAAQLCARPQPQEWSIAQNVHHVADSHMTAYIRCKLIASEVAPALKAYDQDAWAAYPDAMNSDIHTSLALITALHARWADFFAACTPADWERYGVHSVNGNVTLRQQLHAYAAHGEAHLAQIAAVKALL